jgi:hypothetical protein
MPPKVSFGVVICVWLTRAAFAQPLSSVRLANGTTPLLSGEIRMALPAIAEEESPSSLAHGRSTWSMAIDDARFTIVAYETFAFIDGDVTTAVKRDAATQGGSLAQAKVENAGLKAPLVGRSLVPRVTAFGEGNTLVYALYVMNTDQTVQIVAFYVSKNRRAPGEWVELARRIASSTVVGTGRLDLQGGKRILVSEARGVSITLPPRWALDIQDDKALRFRAWQLVPLGDDERHCDVVFDYPDPGVEVGAHARPRAGRLLGTTVEWSSWSEGSTEHVLAGVAREGRVLTVSCHGPAGVIDELRAVVETLRIP